MRITDIRTRGQNMFLGTDTDKSFVLNNDPLPVSRDLLVIEGENDHFTINDVEFVGIYNPHQQVWELSRFGEL